jgi:hypothetical protein
MIAAAIPTNNAGPKPVRYLMASMAPWDCVAAPAT